MSETLWGVFCAFILGGLGADACEARDCAQLALRACLWQTHHRGALDAALASPDPEVRKRAKDILSEYENVLGPDQEWPLIENVEAPARFLPLLKAKQMEADLREMEWAWWGGDGGGIVLVQRDPFARRADSEVVVVGMVRRGLSRPEAIAIIEKALRKEMP